jgi:hypothetical protein
MASHPTAAPRRAAHAALAVGSAAALVLVAGCGPLSMRRLDFDTTESAAVSRVVVRPGSGDVTVRGTGPTDQVRIKRVLRYHGDQPDARHEVIGDELVLETECGARCSVSYEVTVPPGTAVRGEGGSGTIDLAVVGEVDLRLGSGDVLVKRAAGAVRVETGSGSVEVDDVRGPATLRASSGDISGRALAGQVDAEAGSGSVTVELSTPVSARAHADSGDVELIVPAGRYRVRAGTRTGETEVQIANDPTSSLLLDVGAQSGNVTVSER